MKKIEFFELDHSYNPQSVADKEAREIESKKISLAREEFERNHLFFSITVEKKKKVFFSTVCVDTERVTTEWDFESSYHIEFDLDGFMKNIQFYFNDHKEIIEIKKKFEGIRNSDEYLLYQKGVEALNSYQNGVSSLWNSLAQDRSDKGEALQSLCPITLTYGAQEMVIESIRESQGGVRWWITVGGVEDVVQGLTKALLDQWANEKQEEQSKNKKKKQKKQKNPFMDILGSMKF